MRIDIKKLKVGVLMGGRSIEREVSFNSGRTICDHLDSQRFEIIPLFQNYNGILYVLPARFLYRGKTTDFTDRLVSEAEAWSWDDLKKKVDFIYLALHGRYAEDGSIQGLLETLGIPYLGSKVYASALRADKNMHKFFLQQAGISVPRWCLVTAEEIKKGKKDTHWLEEKIKKSGLSFPLMSKPIGEGSSLGVSVNYSLTELQQAVEAASTIDPLRESDIIIEEKIEGMEFSCVVLTDYETNKLFALPPTEIIPDSGALFFNYEQKYMPGRATKITPARCTEEHLKKIQAAALETMEVLEMKTVGRIDGFLTKEGHVVIIDPNAVSGTDPVSFIFRQAAEIGMSHTHLINHCINTELKSYGMYKHENQGDIMKKDSKIRVGVLFGGPSNEREVSLESGRNIVYKLSPEKYEVIPLFLSKNLLLYQLTHKLLVCHSTDEIQQSVDESMHIPWSTLSSLVEFAFIGLHGAPGENGVIQGALEALDIPYNGSGVLTSALCMDKFKTTQFLKGQGCWVPQNILISHQEWLTNPEKILKEVDSLQQSDLIVKPHDDGCSVLVFKVDRSMLPAALEKLFGAGKSMALIEEYLTGMELSVGVFGNATPRALPPSQTIATGDILSIEEKFLPGAGQNLTPAPLELNEIIEVQRSAEKAYKVLNCKGYARIDCFFQKATSQASARVIILEVNTLPALTPATCLFHQAAEIGIQPMDFIDMIVTMGLQEHRPALKYNSIKNLKNINNNTQGIEHV